MSVFTVEQLTGIAEAGAFLRLPDAIYTMLKELESCLEITDADDGTSTTVASSRTDSTRHFRRQDRDSSQVGFRRNGPNPESARQRVGGGKKHGGSSATDALESEDWSAMRAFKPTKIESKTGIEKTVNDIRVALNKMSATNYEKQRDSVLSLVAESEDLLDTANIRRVSKAIFDIASTNKFYSEIYASLYKELSVNHSVFRELLVEFVEGFTNMDSAPIYVDPDKDYDGFCVYSKACDVRKSTSTFLVNCAKLGLIEPDKIEFILRKFLDFISASILQEGQSKVVEEVVENVFIIATLCIAELNPWKADIQGRIRKLVADKSAGHPSFSNRASFKCMDILDKLVC